MARFRKADSCHCRKRPCLCAPWEGALRAEGLGHLDSEDGLGNVLTSNRGAGPRHNGAWRGYQGNVEHTAERAEEREHRLAILANHRFRTKVQRRIWETYAQGLSIRQTAAAVGRDHSVVWEVICAVRAQYAVQRDLPDDQIAELLRECDRSTVGLFFALLKRAVEAPEEMRAAMERLTQRAPLRALLET